MRRAVKAFVKIPGNWKGPSPGPPSPPPSEDTRKITNVVRTRDLRSMTAPSLFVIVIIALAQAPLFPADRTLDARIRAMTREISSELISIRRDINAHPEFSMQEKRTAGLVADHFRKLGLEVRTGIGGAGVMGVLPKDVAKTSVHSPTFIADEDAIPLGVTLMSAVILDYLMK